MTGVLGDRVRSARERLKLSQRDLGQAVGLDHTAIAHIEAGRRAPSVEKLGMLARALVVSADYLLGLTDQPWRAVDLVRVCKR